MSDPVEGQQEGDAGEGMTPEPVPSAPGPDGPGPDEPAADGVAADELAGVLEAAEATLSRKPEIDYLLVADRAEVVNGKLYLMGGSWDRIGPPSFPHRMILGIALGVRIPFAHTDDQHTVAIELHHEAHAIFPARGEVEGS